MKKLFELYKEKKTGDTVYVAPILQTTLKDIQSELVSEFDVDAKLIMDGTRLVGVNVSFKDTHTFVTYSSWPSNELRCICYNEVTKDVSVFPISMLETYIRPFQIEIKYFSEEIEKLQYIGGKSDWIDLRSAAEIEIKQGEFKLIPLGIGMQLPKGYEAHVVPRSSTFKNYGIIQTNSMGIIDETYCGDNDQWFFPAFALRDSVIHMNDRICQFRIMEHQPVLLFSEVDKLENEDRGGHGSTGKQ